MTVPRRIQFFSVAGLVIGVAASVQALFGWHGSLWLGLGLLSCLALLGLILIVAHFSENRGRYGTQFVGYEEYLDSHIRNAASLTCIASGADQIRTYLEGLDSSSRLTNRLTLSLYLRSREDDSRLADNLARMMTLCGAMGIELNVYVNNWDMMMLAAIIVSKDDAAVNFYLRNDLGTRRVWKKYLRLHRGRCAYDDEMLSVVDRWWVECAPRYAPLPRVKRQTS